MAEAGEQDYLSIGEVLGLLLEEFPDVTISKIRFLESQGLIDPERTPSGYRKFYDADVELLRVILREQRENYLPLRVIRDRIETGIIDPSGEMAKPSTAHDDTHDDAHDDERDNTDDADDTDGIDDPGRDSTDEPRAEASATEEVPATSIASHPAARDRTLDPTPSTSAPPTTPPASDTSAAAPRLLPGVLLDRSDLCSLVGLTPNQLDELERYGVVQGRGSGAGAVYGEDVVEIATVAVELLRAGLDARHLRAYRTSAEREVSLYEQLVTPKLRQRNPAARAQAVDELRDLDVLGGRLRAALVRSALRHHFDP